MHATARRALTKRIGNPHIAIVALFVLAAASLSSCAKDSEPEAGSTDPQRTIHVYTVRGEVDALPSPTTDLRIHHEAIPEFIGPAGTVVGMGPMVMAFWPPQGLSLDEARIQELDLDGFTVGDKVMITFEVVHDSQTHAIKGYYASAIEKISAETPLDYSPLVKPESTPAAP